MTSKLTREQLHERARENVKALKMASRQTAFESAREEILADLQLAELALAAMDDSYDITASQLREAVHYNPDTGRFTRRSNGTPMEHLCGSGYYCLNLFKRSRLAHRMAYYYMTGRLPEKVDHIDGNRLNNEWKNLREATHAENMWNTGMITTNASGVKGVHWHKKYKKWVAEIRANKKKYYVGSFSNIEDARLAIEARRKELHGGFYNPAGQVNCDNPVANEKEDDHERP
ncbi:TPA: HNH endonuclease [Klebsiella pneumoniae]|nr:HNH endonuclease [Klebsiella pneumoniae]